MEPQPQGIYEDLERVRRELNHDEREVLDQFLRRFCAAASGPQRGAALRQLRATGYISVQERPPDEDGTQRSPVLQPQRRIAPKFKQGKGYSIKETRKVFRYIHRHGWEVHTGGRDLYKFLSLRRVINRPAQGIQAHVRRMLRRREELQNIIGRDMLRAFEVGEVTARRNKHANFFPLEEVCRRFGMELPGEDSNKDAVD